MATIKPIESASVHRIQSGQVIVDLCSVVKELVENSVDAGATSIEVRFKNNGLDAIEVADNGSGIAEDDYASVALKHYTSKLKNYDDLSVLDTFGFRGEALSSLCAVSDLAIVTARENQAPKATKLEFASNGALKDTSTVAAQRGTTVYVETIFKNLPVRRQELAKNVKREYGKVLGLLQAYACISTTARITVSNIAVKGKKSLVFATKAKQSTRENIVNVFGAKAAAGLIRLDLHLDLQPTGLAQKGSKEVRISGHVSKPTLGEGRQAPDRQMFFVNGRPCTLPQVAKVMNEVYKSYNLSQSPFIFANVELDTSAYDVNVSPDKRTILLHEQGELLESIRTSLNTLFSNQQQSVPQAQSSLSASATHAFRPPRTGGVTSNASDPVALKDGTRRLDAASSAVLAESASSIPTAQMAHNGLIQNLFRNKHLEVDNVSSAESAPLPVSVTAESQQTATEEQDSLFVENDAPPENHMERGKMTDLLEDSQGPASSDRRRFWHDTQEKTSSLNEISPSQTMDTLSADPTLRTDAEEEIPSVRTTPVKVQPGPVPSAFDKMRPMRTPTQQATITIGDQTMTATLGSTSTSLWKQYQNAGKSKPKTRIVSKRPGTVGFQSALKAFAAPGTQLASGDDNPSSDGSIDDEQPDAKRIRLHNLGHNNQNNHEDGEAPSGSEVEAGGVDSHISSEENQTSTEGSDREYIDDDAKKEREEARVARLIQDAEEKALKPKEESIRRADKLLKGGQRHATAGLLTTAMARADRFFRQAVCLQRLKSKLATNQETRGSKLKVADPEEKLSLSVSKEDFLRMRIAGQFNLGFIIASRPALGTSSHADDELFIIDQHASDEKFNFERLQATTIVQSQTLVQKQRLELTAVEEEIIQESEDVLLKNGFDVDFDDSGDYPLGKRCSLVKLPMSKEVTFSPRDLEELIALLAEKPVAPSQPQRVIQSSFSLTAPSGSDVSTQTFPTSIVRPSSVRRMFAMRACRSSVMIGKTLNLKQMHELVENMGKIDKPWNCPHGRPTMRHLFSFSDWQGWDEEDGVCGMAEDEDFARSAVGVGCEVDWDAWLRPEASEGVSEGETSEEEEGSSDGEEQG